MLTDVEVSLLGDALLLRADEDGAGREFWFALVDDVIVEAHHLVETGRLDQRVVNGDLVYRASDEAYRAQGLYAATARRSMN
jgi:hypothetical protein